MANEKLYRIKNRFQLLQVSVRDPNGKAHSFILAHGNNDNIPEYVINDPKIKKRLIDEGSFKVVPMEKVREKEDQRKKSADALSKARSDRIRTESKPVESKPPKK